jgi:hypothetical protein
MVTLLLYLFVALGLAAGVAWMVGHTFGILFATDVCESAPSRDFKDPVGG